MNDGAGQPPVEAAPRRGYAVQLAYGLAPEVGSKVSS